MTVPTGRIVAAVVVILIAVEALTFLDSAPSNTISEVIWRSMTGRPIVPFLGGLLCGHFFWQRQT